MSRASPELNRLAGYLHGAEQEVLEVPRLGQGKLVEAADAALIPPGFRLDATYSGARTRRKNLVYTYLYRELSATVDLPFRDVVFEGVPDPRVEVFDAGVVGADADAPGTPFPVAGGVFGDQVCFPLPAVERLNNPNIPD